MSIRYLPFTRWWHWILCILLATSGLTVSAVIYLTKSPQENNCVSESNLDTAAAIIYCATTSVDEQDAAKLSKAMRLVNTIPKDNPLRGNADNLIERWSQATMYLSQKAFHEGDLRKAVEIAEEIPDNHSSYRVASQQIKEWQSIWSQGENIYASALSEIEDDSPKNWYTALNKAKQLQTLENDYWTNTKYYELVRHIQGAREAREKAGKEQKIASQKPEVDTDTSKSSNDDESNQLKKARTLANSGKIDDMRAALVEASMVISEAYRQDARKFMADTENKIAVLEDNTYLEEAKKLASKNDEISLRMAINEARLIEKGRPLYKKANEYIAMWDKKISQVTLQPVTSIQASNVSIRKAPISQRVKSQNHNQGTFDVKNELDMLNGDSNISSTLSIDKLEEMQINDSSEE